MKLLLPLLLACMALTPGVFAEEDWRKAAHDFLAEHQFAPIEIKPGSRSQLDLNREHHAWMQRVLLPPFEKHLAQWPDKTERIRRFVKQALAAKAGHTDVDPSRPWSVMAEEGMALVREKVDDPLVLWLTAWAVWDSREGYSDAWECLSRAIRHKTLADYPAVLAAEIHDEINDVRRSTDKEGIAKTTLERFKQMMKSASDVSVYGVQDDEILLNDLEFVFSNTNVKERLGELQKLCDTPHFTPWLHEMLQGKLQNRIAWAYRGGGYANTVKDEGWKKFEEHQILARKHFLKAWELRPDRAAAAAAMIDIVKCGNGDPGETTRLWFDRAVAAQFDHYGAYYDLLWSLRPRWGGSVDKMKAFFFACALLKRNDSNNIVVMQRRILDYLEDEVNDTRFLLSQQPMKQIAVQVCRDLATSDHVYRRWQHPWRLADLGLIAWAAGDYETAYDTLQQVPVPFPRQTRRRLDLMGNEADVRAQSALHALGFNTEWDAAEEDYAKHRVNDALVAYQDIAARFQGEPPGLLLERIAACKFEKAFATGEWVEMHAAPDMAEWHHLSGFWTGQKDGTLVNNGHGARAFLLHNGRIGSNFEWMGEYEVKGIPDPTQGLSIILGYHSQKTGTEDWIACSQWSGAANSAVASMLRKFYQTRAPRITQYASGGTWKFHIICRNGVVTYRLNHRDIVIDHSVADADGDTFEMHQDSVVGFFHHFFNEKSHTHIRHLSIRRIETPADHKMKEEAPGNLASLRESFASRRSQLIADLNATLTTESESLSHELKEQQRQTEAGKVEAFSALLKTGHAVEQSDLPSPTADEDSLTTLLRGYRASLEARLSAVRAEWKEKALALKDPSEASEVASFITNELESHLKLRIEEPLNDANTLKWQKQSGQWTRSAELLSGSGDSTMLYDFNRAPPFQIDFEITVLDGMRPRLVMGNVKFANEGFKTTFGLYPQPKGAPLFTYERQKPYQITIKATKDKTELLVDGVKVCDGPKVEGVVDLLQFRGGDDWSKGKSEFRKVKISPLP